MSNITYGYARISTKHQNIARQIENITRECPTAEIIKETYSGTTTDRPQWNKLLERVQKDDTIIFDEVSRMSRNAEEGFKVYQELFSKGVHLIFLKERHIDTAVYQKAIDSQIASTGNKVVDCVLEGVNNALMEMARQQIEIAFEQAQAEVDFLHQRTAEGIRQAKQNGKQIGRRKGAEVHTKKGIATIEAIRKYSKDFGGMLPDTDVMKLVGVDRHTYYKYKGQLKTADISIENA